MSDEVKRDAALWISTTGLRHWRGEDAKIYNRTESTPYKGLDKLFEEYKVYENDAFVDFGAGKGRTSFYVHDEFGIDVSGVELHELTFDELMKNEERYLRNKGLTSSNLYFEFGYAENYKIQPQDTIFYFFNPFASSIFQEVVENIQNSLEKNPRMADLILYYPENSFKRIMKKTKFKRIKTVRLPWKKDPKKKFIIYRYDPDNYSDELEE